MDKEIAALKEELEDLKNQMVLKSMLLSNKITALESRLSPDEPDEAKTDITSHAKATVEPSPAPELAYPADDVDADFMPEEKHDKEEKIEPVPPSFFSLAFQQFLSVIFDWFSPVTAIYKSYKQRGMLGIFLLTLAGVGLVLAGFAYLMQLVIDQLGAGSKSAMLGGSAVAVVIGGLFLKAKTKYAEYASAIVSLGLLLCFLTIYFTGSVYGLVPGLATLVMYALIALCCHYLALYLETKVVAVMGIIGITLLPMIAGASQVAPTLYLMSVWLVSVSSLYIAHKHLGQWLANLTFIFVFLTLGWIESHSTVAMAAWMINAFYLLFFAYLVLGLYCQKQTAKNMMLVAANFGAALLLLLQSTQFGFSELALQFLLNAAVALGIAYYFFREKHVYTTLLFTLAAAWAALAVVALFSSAYWGIAWAIEGLLLIFMSTKYRLQTLLHHGQALTLVAIAYCAAAILPYFPSPALVSLDGWFIILVIGTTLSTWQRLLKPAVIDGYTKTKIFPTLVFAETAWLGLIALTSAFVWLGPWAGLTAIAVQAGMLFRARQTKQSQLEWLAIMLITFPLAYVAMGAKEVGILRFSLLPLYAKASLILAFLQLWLWSAFYRKFYPQSSLASIAELARLAFYFLLPICWLGSAFRHFGDSTTAIVWLSPFISLVLAHMVGSKLLAAQSKVLSVLVIIATLLLLTLFKSYSNGLENVLLAGFALFGLALLYATAYYFEKRREPHDKIEVRLYHFIQSTVTNTTGVIMGVFVASILPTVISAYSGIFLTSILPIAFVTLYSMYALVNKPEYKVFSRNSYVHIVILIGITLYSWLMLVNGSASSAYFALYPLLVLAGVVAAAGRLMSKSQAIPAEAVQKLISTLNNADLWAHGYIAITYVLTLAALGDLGLNLALAPALAAHGAGILFLKNRRIASVRFSFALILLGIAKLALIDAAQVVLWQKVILFIGVGVFILFASFWYQRLVNQDSSLAQTKTHVQDEGSDKPA